MLKIWTNSPTGEKLCVLVMNLIMVLFFQYVPTMWDGMFTAVNSNASKLYGTGLVAYVLCSAVALFLDYCILEYMVRWCQGKEE